MDEEIANISETIRVVQDEVRLGKQEGQQVQEKLDFVKGKMDDLCNNAEVLSVSVPIYVHTHIFLGLNTCGFLNT